MSACTRLLSTPGALRARLRQQHGQAVVEFAIVLPILMLLVLGIIYFGRYESDLSQATQLAETGAREASVNFDVPGTATFPAWVQSSATGELNGTSDVSQVGVRTTCYSSTGAVTATCTAGGTVSVCTQTTVQFPFLGHGSTLFQKATMRVEQTNTSNAAGGTGLTGLTNGTVATTSNAPASC